MALTDLIPIPGNINPGLHGAKQLTMKTLLGLPRGSFTQDCLPVTNPKLKNLVITADVGPFTVTGLQPAVDSLKQVMDEIQQQQPAIAGALSTAGMLCARFQRDSNVAISNHSWGTAIDLKLSGVLDKRGDGRVLEGLSVIAPIFNSHQWFWGAGFPKEDGMHFELSDEKIRELATAGVFGGPAPLTSVGTLSVGDRGQSVKRLQEKLNRSEERRVGKECRSRWS